MVEEDEMMEQVLGLDTLSLAFLMMIMAFSLRAAITRFNEVTMPGIGGWLMRSFESPTAGLQTMVDGNPSLVAPRPSLAALMMFKVLTE